MALQFDIGISWKGGGEGDRCVWEEDHGAGKDEGEGQEFEDASNWI